MSVASSMSQTVFYSKLFDSTVDTIAWCDSSNFLIVRKVSKSVKTGGTCPVVPDLVTYTTKALINVGLPLRLLDLLK